MQKLTRKLYYYYQRSYIEIWLKRCMGSRAVAAEIDIRPLQGGRGQFVMLDQITDDTRAQEIYNTALDLLAKYGDHPNEYEADALHSDIFSAVRSIL